MLPFSVCMSVYRNDRPQDFSIALNSIINQTHPPNEIVLVVDGPVTHEIDLVINQLLAEAIPSKIICLEKNQGHAIARQTGVENATYELIALMDSDDISKPYRFEKQIKEFEKDSRLDVLGGQITEFVCDVDNVVGSRRVPLDTETIKSYIKKRCPFNQVTVMMRKSAMIAVGGYQDWYCDEDYYLWVRMALAKCKFKNLDDILVNVRVGKEMYARRGGVKYFKSEAKLQKYMLTHRFINYTQYVFNVMVRFVVQVLMPNRIRSFVFQKLFRNKA